MIWVELRVCCEYEEFCNQWDELMKNFLFIFFLIGHVGLLLITDFGRLCVGRLGTDNFFLRLKFADVGEINLLKF